MIIFRNSTIFFKMQGLPRDVSIVVYKMLYDEVLKQIVDGVSLKSFEDANERVESDSVYIHIVKRRLWIDRYSSSRESNTFIDYSHAPLWRQNIDSKMIHEILKSYGHFTT